MVEAIAIVGGIFMLIFVIIFTRKQKAELEYMGCLFCGMPCPIPLKAKAVKKAENIFGGEAVHVTVCPDCKAQGKR